MKLYYLEDKWRVNTTNIFLPLYDSIDCLDTEYIPNVTLRVFTENQLFGTELLENYDDSKQIHDYRYIGRVISIHYIETNDLPENFNIEQKQFCCMVLTPNSADSWEKINEYQSSNLKFKNLNWKLHSHIVLNTKKLKASLTNFPNDPHGDLNKLIDIICSGDHPDRLIRLNNLQKMWNNNTESARELYDILCDFTFGDYYDINAEGYAYYREMRYLRDMYNVDPERSKHDQPIEYKVGDSVNL